MFPEGTAVQRVGVVKSQSQQINRVIFGMVARLNSPPAAGVHRR